MEDVKTRSRIALEMLLRASAQHFELDVEDVKTRSRIALEMLLRASAH